MADQDEYADYESYMNQQLTQGQEVYNVGMLPPGSSLTTVGGIPPTPQQTTLMEIRLDFTKTLDRVRNHLEGKVWNPIEKKWEPKGEALLNDKGVNIVMSVLESYLNPNTVLGYYEDWEIRERVKTFGNVMLDTLFANAPKIGLDINNLGPIVLFLTHEVEAALRRARKGTEAEQISKSHQIIEEIQSQTKRGLLPFGKG